VRRRSSSKDRATRIGNLPRELRSAARNGG
jgi:hypothetical protein